MKWEKLKNQVACDVYDSVMNGWQYWMLVLIDMVKSDFKIKSGLHSYEVIGIYAEKARLTVLDWDVRRVGGLREAFPDLFPKSLRTGNLVAGYDEDGDWTVERAMS